MLADLSCLVVIDVQNDFCRHGALEVPQGDTIVPLCNALMTKASLVVLTQDWHCADHRSFVTAHPGYEPFSTVSMEYGVQVLWPVHCVAGTRGAEFHPDLNLDHASLMLRKGSNRAIDSYSAFFENDRITPTGLDGYLKQRNIQHITFCGLALDYCVAWSALDARRCGYSVNVVSDACRAIDLDGSLDRATTSMQDAGIKLVTYAHAS